MSRHDELDETTFGGRLKKARLTKGLSQAALAISVANVTDGRIKLDGSSVSRYERGDVENPRLDLVAAFAQVTEQPLAYLTGAMDLGDRLAIVEETVGKILDLNQKSFESIRQTLARLEAQLDAQAARAARQNHDAA